MRREDKVPMHGGTLEVLLSRMLTSEQKTRHGNCMEARATLGQGRDVRLCGACTSLSGADLTLHVLMSDKTWRCVAKHGAYMKTQLPVGERRSTCNQIRVKCKA